MPLAWNEIRHRAIKFTNEWTGTQSESADKQTFWNEFFEVFGVARKTVASFEAPVRKVNTGHDGFIDLFWKGMLIVEHKSLGGNLNKAQSQAFDYIQALAAEGKHKEIPRWVIVSDFARVVLYDLEPEDQPDLPLFNNRRVAVAADFTLNEFHKNIRPFAFIAGYKQQKLDPEDPANLEAAGMMADLHDALKAGGYTGHELRQFLVRILFCLFAEDTGIFPQPRMFELYLQHHTAPDGSDLGLRLARLFEVLNTNENKRQLNLDADLREFPYINGDLFKEHLSFADFNTDMRNALLACCGFRWEKISPAVFGSLFQEVMLAPERRQLGAHYTAEKNIMKVVRSLFLDDLREEFDRIKQLKIGRDKRVEEFHDKLSKLTFFDPACGCGNFLVITYRELRALELEVLQLKHGKQHEMTLDAVNKLSRLDVDQMFGIEYEEFPARIAEVALWLTDHQMNVRLSEAFSQFYLRIPLRKSPHIHVGNALRKDWKEVIPPEKCSYILGNPPFVGKHLMNAQQDEDMAVVWDDLTGAGFLDYVTGWYIKAAKYIAGTKIVVGFVSTNSITQGEQAGILWSELFQKHGIKIQFAHRTFTWESEARGRAHVHVVIVGLGAFNPGKKTIYEYADDEDHPVVSSATNISPYLIEGPDVALPIRRQPVCNVPPIVNGNKPADGGFLIVEDEDRAEFLKNNSSAAPYLREMLSADQYLNGEKRWVLWLVDAPPHVVKDNPGVHERVKGVREFRLQSPKESTKRMADKPTVFDQIRQPTSRYLLIPRHSSENRRYVPFGYFTPDIIISDSCTAVPDATPYHFGVISSAMHMAWMRQVCGRLESRYRYSNKLVYNNFPWPQGTTAEQKGRVEAAAQAVLEARAQFPDSTLADLYDPVAMPPVLAKAHAELDRAVDRCYRKEPFPSDRARVEFLFQLYEQLTAPLLPATKPKRSRAGKRSSSGDIS